MVLRCVQQGISAFIDTAIERFPSTFRALDVLRKFEKLALPGLDLEDKYVKVIAQYMRELDQLTKLYHKQKTEPPMARDLPPIAGRIVWARQLFARIRDPMSAFEAMPALLANPECQHAVRAYNKLAKVLLEYEMLFHRAWLRQTDVARQGLLASLLVRHPETFSMPLKTLHLTTTYNYGSIYSLEYASYEYTCTSTLYS